MLKRLITIFLLLLAPSAYAQIPGGNGLVIGNTPITGGPPVVGDCLTVGSGNKLGQVACSTTTGTVTSVSVTTANGISGSVATPTTTPAITLTLGAITPTSVNGNTITTGTGVLTLGAGKTATVSNTLTFTGTDSSSVAFGAGGTVLYGPVALSTLATQATNTVVGNATSGTAAPTALAVGSCSTAASALIWTTNTGFGCNTSITAASMPGSGITGSISTAGGTNITSGGSLLWSASGSTSPGSIYRDANFSMLITGGTSSPAAAELRYLTSGGTNLLNLSTAGVLTVSTGLNVTTMAQTSAAQSGTVCYNSGTGAITYDATLGCLASSERFKTDIVDIQQSDALTLTMALTPVSFRKRPEFGGASDASYHVGFIAERVAEVDERLVSRNEDGVRGVRYQELTAILAGAIQELKREIIELRAAR